MNTRDFRYEIGDKVIFAGMREDEHLEGQEAVVIGCRPLTPNLFCPSGRAYYLEGFSSEGQYFYEERLRPGQGGLSLAFKPTRRGRRAYKKERVQMAVKRTATESKAEFQIGLNITLKGSKEMSVDEQDALVTVEQVRVIIVDVGADVILGPGANTLIDTVLDATAFKTGSVGYMLHGKAEFSR